MTSAVLHSWTILGVKLLDSIYLSVFAGGEKGIFQLTDLISLLMGQVGQE